MAKPIILKTKNTMNTLNTKVLNFCLPRGRKLSFNQKTTTRETVGQNLSDWPVEPIKKEGLPLPNVFFKTDVVQSRKIQNLLTGMTAQGAKEFGPKMANAVRLQLFKNDDDIFGNDLG